MAYKKEKIIMGMNMMKFLIKEGHELLKIKNDVKNNGRFVFMFEDTEDLEKSISKYIKLKEEGILYEK